MRDTLKLFIDELFKIARTIPFNKFPIDIDGLIYDPRFVSEPYDEIEELEEKIQCYNHIFNILDEKVAANELCFICDSTEIDDDIIYGDYDVYNGWIYDDAPLIYFKASHPYECASRIIIFNYIFTYDIIKSRIGIETYPTPHETKILLNDKIVDRTEKLHKRQEIIDLLKHQDRPSFM